MGGFVAQALYLVDQADRMGLGINGIAADAADRVFLARAVFVDHEEAVLILGQGEPGRIVGLDHLQRLGVDLPGGTVEIHSINALAGVGGVGANQQLEGLGVG